MFLVQSLHVQIIFFFFFFSVAVCFEGFLCDVLQPKVQAHVHGQEGGSRLRHLSFCSDDW